MSECYPFHIKFIIAFFMSLRNLGWDLQKNVTNKMDCAWVILVISLFFISDEGQFYCLLLSHSNLPDEIRPTNIRHAQVWHVDFLTGKLFFPETTGWQQNTKVCFKIMFYVKWRASAQDTDSQGSQGPETKPSSHTPKKVSSWIRDKSLGFGRLESEPASIFY